MSYWAYLENEGEVVSVNRHAEGGTVAIGGTDLAEVNITYNYGRLINEYLDGGLRWLDGKRAVDTIEKLAEAVIGLGTEQDPDYWAATPGNAGYALSVLLGWAREHPNAVWRIS